MSLPHFYLERQVIADETASSFVLMLSAEDAKHARVLRLAAPEHIAVIDAAADYFECEIVAFDDDMPIVRIARRFDAAPEQPHVVLVQGMAKGDKMETVIRHATELGVERFVPWTCERSIVRLDARKAESKTQRWRAIAKSAAMQSGQRRIPAVDVPVKTPALVQNLAQAAAVLICWEEAAGTLGISSALNEIFGEKGPRKEPGSVYVVIGPEGGLTATEVDMLLASNEQARLVSLGSSILRTETAGIVASALTIHELGGLGNASALDAKGEDA